MDDYTMPEQESTLKETDAKCPNCGASISFNPSTGKLLCPFCGFEKDVPPPEAGAALEELDFEEAEHTGNFEWGASKKMVICKSCGAESIYDELDVSNVCPFCGSNQVVEANDENSLAPNGVCPFEVTSKQAESNFYRWIKRKWFTPSAAKKQAKADAFKGVYLPFWTYDTDTLSNYSARAGKDRQVKDGDGYKTVTDWFPVWGVYHEFINDELVNASSKLEDDMLDRIRPYVLEKGKPYQPEYVSGFITERYSVGLKSGWENARRQIQRKLQDHIESDIRFKHNADHVSGLNFSTVYSRITYKYLMLPVWMSSFQFGGKLYRFLVNGQTGKVGGKAPVSALRVIIACIIGIAALVALWYLFGNM